MPHPDPWTEVVARLWQGGKTPPPQGKFGLVVTCDDATRAAAPAEPGTEAGLPGLPDDGGMPDPAAVVGLARAAHEAWARGDAVLVRCADGLHRAGLVVTVVLIIDGWDPQHAMERVRSRRHAGAVANASYERWILGTAADAVRRNTEPSAGKG